MLDPGTYAEHEAMQVLREAGVPTAEETLCTDADGAVDAAEAVGLPVVLKVASSDITHKTEVGGVMTAHTVDEVRARFKRITDSINEQRPDADIDGIIVAEQLEGQEMVVGVSRDQDFGHVLMFGLGGIYVEVFEDVGFRAIPVDRPDAEDLIAQRRAKALLDGVRGNPPGDIDALVDVLLAVSDLVEANPEIAALDINPLFVSADGATAGDAVLEVADDG